MRTILYILGNAIGLTLTLFAISVLFVPLHPAIIFAPFWIPILAFPVLVMTYTFKFFFRGNNHVED